MPPAAGLRVLNAVYRAMRLKNFAPTRWWPSPGSAAPRASPTSSPPTASTASTAGRCPWLPGCASPAGLKTLVFGGDGDAFAIGAGHFVHAMRRNLDITYVVMDNAIYRLTKGQTSPTSGAGFSTSPPQGNPEQALNPLMAARRRHLRRPRLLRRAPEAGRPDRGGIEHPGFSFIDVYSPCPTFSKVNTFKYYKDNVAWLPGDHDASDVIQAMHFANSSEPLYLGVFLQRGAHLRAAGGGAALGKGPRARSYWRTSSSASADPLRCRSCTRTLRVHEACEG